MGGTGLERLDRQEDEVVAVPGEEDALSSRDREVELFPIGVTPAVHFVNAEDVETETSRHLSDGRSQVFVEEEP